MAKLSAAPTPVLQLKRKADKEVREAKQQAETKLEDVATNLRKQVQRFPAEGGVWCW